MRITIDDFASDEQYREHKAVLKLPEIRYYNSTFNNTAFLIWYKRGVADNAFMIEYLNDGGTNLYFLHASFDNVKTLKELLKVPKCTKATKTDSPSKMSKKPNN